MSDRVRFATTNYSEAPEFSASFNGFTGPFNTNFQPGSVATAVPFVQMHGWYWRVRNWRITATDFGVTAAASTYSVATGPLTPIALYTRERDLVLGNHQYFQQTDRFNFQLFQGVSGGDSPAIKFDGTSYFPSVIISGGLGITDGTTGDTMAVDFGPDPDGADGGLTAIVDGVNFPIYYRIVTDVGDTSFSFTQLVLDPVEYWPYAAADGSPIFDTATGARLQDPRN